MKILLTFWVGFLIKLVTCYILITKLETDDSDLTPAGDNDNDYDGGGSRGKRQYFFVEGDILVREQEHAGIINPDLRWPEGRVYYKISSSFNDEETRTILSGMEEIGSKTCIQFEERSIQPNFVYFVKQNDFDCWSELGRVGGPQLLNLGHPNCITKGTVAHELIHALGFFHEHTRSDRDAYVNIIWNNIDPSVPGARIQFLRRAASTVTDFGVPYDYGSVMHYPLNAMSKDPRLMTIVPTSLTFLKFDIGQRKGLSELDALKIRRMYNLVNVTCGHSNNPTTIMTSASTLATIMTSASTLSTIMTPSASTSTTIKPFEELEPWEKSVLRPRATICTHYKPNKRCEEFNEEGYDVPSCLYLQFLPYGVDRTANISGGSCVRFYKEQYCMLESLALYPKMEEKSDDERTSQEIEFVSKAKSVGGCFEKELEKSSYLQDPDSMGFFRFKKMTVGPNHRPIVPDKVDRVAYVYNTTSIQRSKVGGGVITDYRTGFGGRVEFILAQINGPQFLRPVPLDDDFIESVDQEEVTNFYAGLDKEEGDQMGFFLSPKNFVEQPNLPFVPVFPQTPANRRDQMEVEQHIREQLTRPQYYVNLFIEVEYQTERDTRPIGIVHRRQFYDELIGRDFRITRYLNNVPIS